MFRSVAVVLVLVLGVGCHSTLTFAQSSTRTPAGIPAIVARDSLDASYTLDSVRTSLLALSEMTREVRDANRRDTFVGQLVKDYISNGIWEFLGFKRQGKTIVSLLFSLLGMITFILKIRWSVAGKSKPEPRWLKLMLAGYLVLTIVTFAVLTFGSTTSQDIGGDRGASKMLANRIDKLATETTRQLHAIEGKVDAMGPRQGAGTGVGSQGTSGGTGNATADISRLEGLVRESVAQSTNAARDAATASKDARVAAGHSEWGGFIWVTLLLVIVLLTQLWPRLNRVS